MAIVKPKGKATEIAMRVVSSVPQTRGKMPNFLLAKSGVHSVPVKNSTNETCLKNPIVSVARTIIIPSVVKTVTRLQKIRKPSITFSLIFSMVFS